MSTRIIKTKTKSATTNPIPPPQPKGLTLDATDEIEQDKQESDGEETAKQSSASD